VGGKKKGKKERKNHLSLKVIRHGCEKGQRSCCLVNDGRVLQLLNLIPREKHRHPEALWQLMNVRPPKGVLLGSLSQQFQP
jgi:hypothetical protein